MDTNKPRFLLLYLIKVYSSLFLSVLVAAGDFTAGQVSVMMFGFLLSLGFAWISEPSSGADVLFISVMTPVLFPIYSWRRCGRGESSSAPLAFDG